MEHRSEMQATRENTELGTRSKLSLDRVGSNTGVGSASEAKRCRCAGAGGSDRACSLGLQKAKLTLAHISEMGFIDQRIAYGPGVGEIPLLVAEVVVVAEAGDVGAGLFKRVVGLKLNAVVEIVVRGQALVIVDSVV